MSRFFSFVVVAFSIALSSPASAKGSQKGQQVVPVPNLMGFVVRNEAALKLSPEQKKSLAAWRDQNLKPMRALVQEVKEAKKAILKASLAGVSLEEILKMEKAVEENRVALITVKVRCRDHMKSTLDATQWEKVLSLRTEARANKKAKKQMKKMKKMKKKNK